MPSSRDPWVWRCWKASDWLAGGCRVAGGRKRKIQIHPRPRRGNNQNQPVTCYFYLGDGPLYIYTYIILCNIIYTIHCISTKYTNTLFLLLIIKYHFQSYRLIYPGLICDVTTKMVPDRKEINLSGIGSWPKRNEIMLSLLPRYF